MGNSAANGQIMRCACLICSLLGVRRLWYFTFRGPNQALLLIVPDRSQASEIKLFQNQFLSRGECVNLERPAWR